MTSITRSTTGMVPFVSRMVQFYPEKTFEEPIWSDCIRSYAMFQFMKMNTYQNQMQEGRFHASEILRIIPNYSLKLMKLTNLFKEPKEPPLIQAEELLRKAGIPEE